MTKNSTLPIVYLISGSAPAWRVLLALEVKGVDYQTHVLQTSQKEQKQDWFLAINPRGQIPVFKDGAQVVTESLAIMHYIDAKHPQYKIFGESPDQVAQIEQSCHELLSYTDKAITAFVQPVFRNKLDDVFGNLPDIGNVIMQELSICESSLAKHGFLAGDKLSAADIVMIPTMQRLKRAVSKAPDAAREAGLDQIQTEFSVLQNWTRMTENTAEFEKTYPEHWKS